MGGKWWNDEDLGPGVDDDSDAASTLAQAPQAVPSPPPPPPSPQSSSPAEQAPTSRTVVPLFVWLGDRESGPFSVGDVQTMLDDRSIDARTMVREVSGTWVAAGQMPGLTAAPTSPSPPPPVATRPALPTSVTTNNPLAIVAVVLGSLGLIGGVTVFLSYASSEEQRLAAKLFNTYVSTAIGVIVFCAVAMVLSVVAKGQIVASAGRQSGLLAASLARWFALGGIATAFLAVALVQSA